jgi:hypothetical protein
MRNQLFLLDSFSRHDEFWSIRPKFMQAAPRRRNPGAAPARAGDADWRLG